MKLTLGAEPKKVAAVAILLPVAAYMLYTNVFTSNVTATTSPPPASVPALDIPREGAASTQPPRPQPSVTRDRRRAGVSSQEWVPKIGGRRPEDQIDPASVDPTLRVDLLSRLAGVTIQGGQRSLFDFSSAPPAKQLPPDVKVNPKDPKKPEDAKPPELATSTEVPKPPESTPPPPPIPLKFYGFVHGSDGKRAFFLNGEDILMASEGETLQSRFKVVRIGLNTAVVEDVQHSNRQTIRLEDPPQGL